MRAFAQQLFSMVRAGQSRLNWSDPLLRHEVARVRSSTHDYAFLDRPTAVERSRGDAPNEARHTEAFYKKLDGLLQDADLTSVAYRGNGDYRLLRMLCNEQRRRADRTGHDAGHALHISALVNQRANTVAWDAEVMFYDEGIRHGDLFIEEGALAASVKELIEVHHRILPGRYILSTGDEGEIAGYDAESGDGWVLYRNRGARRCEPVRGRRLPRHPWAARRSGRGRVVGQAFKLAGFAAPATPPLGRCGHHAGRARVVGSRHG